MSISVWKIATTLGWQWMGGNVWHLVEEDVVCLEFSRSFDIVSHNVLIDKLMKYGLDKRTVRQMTEN